MSEPPITRQAAHTSAGDNFPVYRIVIHATCPDVGYPTASKAGAASGTAKYFQLQSSGGSAHYIEGVDREEHCVRDEVVAWHAPPNPYTIGIEITADGGDPSAYSAHPGHAYTRDQWLSPAVWPAVVRAAARTRELCTRLSVPAVRLSVADVKAGRKGICGHVDVSKAFGQTDHSDPGPNFPWAEFMGLVLGRGSVGGGVSRSPGTTGRPPIVSPPQHPSVPGPGYAFPLPAGYHFGLNDGTNYSVSGAFPRSFKGHDCRWWLREFAKQLALRGWPLSLYLKSGNDGVFGTEYDSLVIAFQRDRRLVPDGKIGPATWDAAFRTLP